MKIRYLIFALAVTIITSGSAFTQASKKNQLKPEFDAKLAGKLGADEYGMRSYVLVILKTGPANIEPGAERDELFRGHFANMGRLADEGKLSVAGPFGENDRGYRGLFILNVATVDEARSLTETDPAVKAGLFIAEFTPWYGSASLMATPEIHKKIARKNP